MNAVPRFEPLSALPDEGSAVEGTFFDLKREMDPAKRFEMAKDIAAFANRLGGCIVLGAEEESNRIKAYNPLSEGLVAKLETAFSEALGSRCSPRPIVHLRRFPKGAGFVLVVNVEPYLGQVVGVSIKGAASDGFGGDAYVFPVRTVKDTEWLLPEQVPMFSIPHVRRAAILLGDIPDGSSVRVVHRKLGGQGFFQMQMTFKGVDERANAVKLDGTVYPLDQVRTVYKNAANWIISFDYIE